MIENGKLNVSNCSYSSSYLLRSRESVYIPTKALPQSQRLFPFLKNKRFKTLNRLIMQTPEALGNQTSKVLSMYSAIFIQT